MWVRKLPSVLPHFCIALSSPLVVIPLFLGRWGNFYSIDAADRLGQQRHWGEKKKKKNNLLRLKRLRTETHSKAILGTVICSLISTAHSDLEEAGYADSRCKFETASPAMQAGSVDSAAEPAAMFLSPLYRLWEAFNRLFESLQGVPIVETR